MKVIGVNFLTHSVYVYKSQIPSCYAQRPRLVRRPCFSSGQIRRARSICGIYERITSVQSVQPSRRPATASDSCCYGALTSNLCRVVALISCWTTSHCMSEYVYCRLIAGKVHRINRCLGGAAVRQDRTRDRKVAGSSPGRGAIKSTRSTQLSIPSR